MTLQVFNDTNELIFDSQLPQLALVLSGTVTPPSNNIGVSGVHTATFPTSIQNPVLYIRQRTLNDSFFFGTISSTQFTYKSSGGIFDYRVYSSDFSMTPQENYGIESFNGSGSLLYRSSFNSPDIRQRTLLLGNGESGSATKDIVTTVVAADGGRPFVLAAPFSTAFNSPIAPNQGRLLGLAFNWKSANTITVGTVIITSSGPTDALLGYRPRYIYFIR